MSSLNGNSIATALDFSLLALSKSEESEWGNGAGRLEWSCLETLNHLINVTLNYSIRLATRSQNAIPVFRDINSKIPVWDSLEIFKSTTQIVIALAKQMGKDDRVFHPAGMADSTGYVAMTCAEIVLHSYDISQGLGVSFTPDSDLVIKILTRLFPWVILSSDPWLDLLWATGRADISGRESVDERWWWHCTPLEEWDGTIKTRT